MEKPKLRQLLDQFDIRLETTAEQLSNFGCELDHALLGLSQNGDPDPESLPALLACVDYTSLKETDTPESIAQLARKAVELIEQGLPAVATLCVYPSLVEAAGVALGDSPIGITAVCGAFPSGQTYLEVKMLECAMAVENGADEIDLVLNVGAMIASQREELREEKEALVRSELEMLRAEIGAETTLKVILETGSLLDTRLIERASILAIEAGADFIKTSTGKTPISAKPSAVSAMCNAVRAHYNATGRRVGIKVSGGIKTPGEALLYHEFVKRQLGPEWGGPDLFRIGASTLIEPLVKAIQAAK